jgi:hypothetical protein
VGGKVRLETVGVVWGRHGGRRGRWGWERGRRQQGRERDWNLSKT